MCKCMCVHYTCRCINTQASVHRRVCVCVCCRREVRTEEEERDYTLFRGPVADTNLMLLYGHVLQVIYFCLLACLFFGSFAFEFVVRVEVTANSVVRCISLGVRISGVQHPHSAASD